MRKPRKSAVWVSIFSTLFAGCYTSVMLEPNEKEKLYTEEITSAVTKDGKNYHFDTAPAIVNGSIVGGAKIKLTDGYIEKDGSIVRQVTIPLSDVGNVSVARASAGRSATGALVIAGTAGLLLLATGAGALISRR